MFGTSNLDNLNSSTEVSHFEKLSRNGTEQDRQIEEPEEWHEPDLLDQQENATREKEEERRREVEEETRREAKKEEEKRKKIEEIDRNIQSQIDYFQEIAESLKAFACMMVDMKVVKVEIRNIKSMLQELTGKTNRDRERVREDNAREEQWKNRDGERVREDTARYKQQKNRDGERVREDTARHKQQKNRDGERVREDTARYKQQKNRDRERVREDNAREEQPKERDGGKMDAGRVILKNDYRTHVNMGEDENYTGNEYLEESDDDQAERFVDILGDDSDSGDDGFGIEERGARRIDEDSVQLDKMGEEDSRSDARISVSERDKEDLGQEKISVKATSSERVTTDVEKACSKKRMAWEKLSMGVICHLYKRAISKGNFARSVLRKLVGDDILVKSTCSGKGGRPYEQAIDPDILQYALETTYDVYGVEEHAKEKCRRECVQSIDSHCRQLFNSQTKKPSNRDGMSERKAQGTEMPPWQRLSDKEIVKVKISKVKQDGLEVIQLPGNKPAFIPKTHLSDHPDICDALLASYSEGDVIDQALTWSYSGKSRTCIVTCKPLLLNAARNKTEIVRDFSELETNMFLIGVLRHTMSYGVFVEFPNHIVGLAPKAMMSDEFVSDTSKLYEVGQTLRAKVTEVNVEKKRFLVSLKTSDCFQDDAEVYTGLAGLEAYFRDRDRAELLLKEKKEFKHVISHKVGSLVHATVRSTPGKGIICSLPHAVDAVIPQDHVHGKSPKVGDSIEACVMNIDLSSKAVTLSLKPDTIEGCKKSKSKGKKGKKAVASLAEDKGKVLMVKSEFILAQTGQGKLVYLSAKQHLNNFSVQKDAIKIGDTVTIGDSSFVDGRFLAALVKEDKPSKKKEKERKSAAVHDTSQKLVGQIVDAVVKSVKESQVNIEIEGGQGYGRIHATEVSDTMKPGSYPLEFFTIGQKVKAKVIGCRRGKRGQHLAVSHGHGALSLLELSTRKSVMEADSVPSEDQSSENEMNAFQIGQTVTCIINRFHKEILWVHLSRSLEGKIHRLNLSKHASTLENPESYFKPGQVHRAKVVRQDNEHNMLELSMSGCIATTFEVGSVVNCKVTKILENKAQVQLPYGLQGSMFATDIDDIYQENPLERFEHHKYHRCCISEASTGKHGASVSMRPSQVKKATPPSGYDLEIRTLDDLKKGQVVRGYVRHCSEKGVFVSLSSNLHGRILLKKLSAFYVKDPSAVFTVGKLLSTKVLSIDKKSGKIELSSSSKDTGLEDPVPEDQRQAGVKRKRDGTKKGKKSTEDGNDSGLGEADPLSDTEAEIITVAKKSSSDTPRLQISSGFSWGDTTTKPATSRKAGTADESDDDDDEEDEEEEEDNEPPVKTSKKDLKEEEKAQEDILYKTERALMDAERTPETPEDFDRLVASSPNSSLAWIRYMAFYLHSVDIEKARAIAERALKTINFREEQEKLNVWVAYLNLENLYGTEEEVVAVFKRALQQCEPIKVFQQLVSIYTRTSKIEQAEQLYETMVKRFKFDPDVWIGFGTFLMKHGKHDPARRLMQRSFKSLIQKDHVSVIVKFAQLEYRHAESERGKTMFENILSNYPKRTDIWSIYLDLTIKQGDTGTSRHLFERVINLKLSAKKVKFFFKRFLDFEKKYGDESTINSVKQKAVDYVESKTVVAEDS
ncbi:protein RRP5 homolog [Strongylocentrotus purpuratus]|uniref:S1 motif domain-containing protein n=1 Tax=Strongylocentrotus purpuratus TaxID=7668 RepID=A0A7M7SZ86_STRPU|nr:protein RRP5 homolog [Strongylocentrotus purpuratus]